MISAQGDPLATTDAEHRSIIRKSSALIIFFFIKITSLLGFHKEAVIFLGRF
jgi:hypothetical protein